MALFKQPKADKDGCIPLWMTDRDCRLPRSLRTPSRLKLDGSGQHEKGVRISQEGTFAFPKRKKNGSKLLSQSTIQRGYNQTTRKHRAGGLVGSCAECLPKIKLDSSDLTV